MLGQPGQGFNIAMVWSCGHLLNNSSNNVSILAINVCFQMTLDAGRIGVASQGVGVAQVKLE